MLTIEMSHLHKLYYVIYIYIYTDLMIILQENYERLFTKMALVKCQKLAQ